LAGLLIGIVVIAVLVIILGGGLVYAGFFGTVVKGNFYYTESGVLNQLQQENPEAGITGIYQADTDRNVWADSVIVVIANGNNIKYCLDSDLFFDYQFRECN